MNCVYTLYTYYGFYVTDPHGLFEDRKFYNYHCHEQPGCDALYLSSATIITALPGGPVEAKHSLPRSLTRISCLTLTLEVSCSFP